MATALRTPPLDEAAIATMKAAFRGEVIRGEDPGYDDARRVFNAAVDRRPALIARPVDVGDIQTALQFGIDSAPGDRGPRRRPPWRGLRDR